MSNKVEDLPLKFLEYKITRKYKKVEFDGSLIDLIEFYDHLKENKTNGEKIES